MPVNSSLTLPVCVVSARKYRAAATLYAVLTAIAPQTLCTVAACESFRTLDMPKRLKHFVNVQQSGSIGRNISPLAHPIGGILAL
jgi:hypothetical protein